MAISFSAGVTFSRLCCQVTLEEQISRQLQVGNFNTIHQRIRYSFHIIGYYTYRVTLPKPTVLQEHSDVLLFWTIHRLGQHRTVVFELHGHISQ